MDYQDKNNKLWVSRSEQVFLKLKILKKDFKNYIKKILKITCAGKFSQDLFIFAKSQVFGIVKNRE